MKSKGRNRLLSLIICICIAFAFSSCVKNDLPYPVVRLSITGFEVNGQIGSAVINNEERTVSAYEQQFRPVHNTTKIEYVYATIE